MEFIKAVAYPSEFWALVRFKFGGGKEIVMPKLDYATLTPGMQRCYELLNQTSRSFAAVIQALDDDLRPAVSIFYLVLRALDTVEDDMTIPLEKKVFLLKEFHTYLYQPEWKFTESQEKDKAVLEEFPIISGEFRKLKPVLQEVIADITQKMGSGMTVFLESKVGTMAEWDEYCHYVAGLVGIGLSRLFAASGLENEQVGRDQRLANSMGLFLQKTNIIRDYLEDSYQEREFWPREAWSQFAVELKDFRYPENRAEAVHCLNMLITNAMQHVPDVLEYMSRLQNQSVFNFCAIPQTMAVATLALCYNNPDVFTRVVKIRKGQTVGLMMQSTTMDNFRAIMAEFAQEIANKIDSTDPLAKQTAALTEKVKEQCCQAIALHTTNDHGALQYKLPIAGLAAVAAISYVYWIGYFG